MTDAPASLIVRGLRAERGEHPVLDRLELRVPAAGRAAVLGPSGVGKTTLLRCIAGLHRPGAGSIEIAGRTVFGPGVDLPPPQRGVAMVFQSYALWPHRTVREHLELVAAEPAEVDAWLERVHLAGLGQRHPGQLSGGEQARLALARALAARPRLLLLDEPFRNLDSHLAGQLREELEEWRQAGAVATLLVTHQIEEAFACADVLYAMVSGVPMASGSPRRLYRDPGSAEVARLLGPGEVLAGRVSNHRLESDFGPVPLQGAELAEGPGRVLLRPEDLSAEPAATGSGNGEVVGDAFRGPDSILGVQVAGRRYRVQVSAQHSFAPGDRVQVSVRRPLPLLESR